MVMALPYSSASFAKMQDKLVTVIAKVVSVQKNKVSIMGISQKALARRHLLDTSIDVRVRILVDSRADGERIIRVLCKDLLNTALANFGMDPITFVSKPTIVVESLPSTTTATSGDSVTGGGEEQSWIVSAAIGSGLFVISIGTYHVYKRRKLVSVAPDYIQPPVSKGHNPEPLAHKPAASAVKLKLDIKKSARLDESMRNDSTEFEDMIATDRQRRNPELEENKREISAEMSYNLETLVQVERQRHSEIQETMLQKRQTEKNDCQSERKKRYE